MTSTPIITRRHVEEVVVDAAAAIEGLPTYKESQKEEQERYYKEFSAGIRAAECAYEGSSGRLRLPPGNVISYVLRRAYKAKHRMTRSNSASSAESSDSEDASPTSPTVLVPGYRHNDQPASDA